MPTQGAPTNNSLTPLDPPTGPSYGRIQGGAGKRWVVERTHSWMNGYGKIRRCTEKRRVVAELYLYLAATLTVLRRLINEARTRYRWSARPTTRRLK